LGLTPLDLDRYLLRTNHLLVTGELLEPLPQSVRVKRDEHHDILRVCKSFRPETQAKAGVRIALLNGTPESEKLRCRAFRPSYIKARVRQIRSAKNRVHIEARSRKSLE
jgi:hypothetical protein